MNKRFAALWFPNLCTDFMLRRKPQLKNTPFVLAAPDHGRMVVQAADALARAKGIDAGMVVADCRAIIPPLEVFDFDPTLPARLLRSLAEWCMGYTPVVAVDLPDGLLLDTSGCTHLWGGEQAYIHEIGARLECFGYHIKIAMADTIGTAWAMVRYGNKMIVEPGMQQTALASLPPAALRLEPQVLNRLEKLGLYYIESFMKMPRPALRIRFGDLILTRLNQALGITAETIMAVRPVEPYEERLPSLEPIRSAQGIAIALDRLLQRLCMRLAKEGKGLRKCLFTCYRVDGNIQQVGIETTLASSHVEHLYKLFEIKTGTLRPDFGFELFLLVATVVDEVPKAQDTLWNLGSESREQDLAKLLDRLSVKTGTQNIHRYLPHESYLPERSFKEAATLQEKPRGKWRTDLPRPLYLLQVPEPITVMVPIPDYPPMLFIHKHKRHKINKADGPERIEQEWWLHEGRYRDYYNVEDEDGARYWLFRLGSYDDNEEPGWYLHGYYA